MKICIVSQRKLPWYITNNIRVLLSSVIYLIATKTDIERLRGKIVVLNLRD
jgi:hypothetical protein